ncbi:MAG: hypothetical protein ACE5EW_03970 [Thermoplasmata archaeon]
MSRRAITCQTKGSLVIQRVVWLGSATLVGGTILGFLTPVVPSLTNNVAWTIMVSALVLMIFGFVTLGRPETGLMARRITGAGTLIAGVILGVLLFGPLAVFGMSGNLTLGQMIEVLVFYVPFFALQGDPFSVAAVLGTVLFWGGIVLLLSSVRKRGPSAPP